MRWSKTPPGALPLFADQAPAVVLFRHGKGTVVAVSDPGTVDNRYITKADNARFITDLVRAYAGAGERIGFDEYHQGFQEADNFWDAVGRPGQLAAWQLFRPGAADRLLGGAAFLACPARCLHRRGCRRSM